MSVRGRKNNRAQRESRVELYTQTICVKRVAKVVKGGKRFRFFALVVVGDQKGHVGYGEGKAREVSSAVQKATENAKKSMVYVSMRQGRTLHHDVIATFTTSKVILMSAPEGSGIVAGGTMRMVLEAVGIQDAVCKSLGSSNSMNVVKATFKALQSLNSARLIASKRGLSVNELFGVSSSRDADVVQAL